MQRNNRNVVVYELYLQSRYCTEIDSGFTWSRDQVNALLRNHFSLLPLHLLGLPLLLHRRLELLPGGSAKIVQRPSCMSHTWPLTGPLGMATGPKLVRYPLVEPKGDFPSKAGGDLAGLPMQSVVGVGR